MPNVIQGQYDELTNIVQTFDQMAQQTTQLQQTIQRCVESLQNGGWVGLGAQAFFSEMQSEVTPALKRLGDAMTQGAQTTQQTIQIFRDAEEEAGKLFNGDGGGGGGSPAPAPNPGDGLTKKGPANGLFGAGHFDAGRAQYTVGKPTEVADHPFRSGKATALKYEVEINGKKLTVYMPKTTDSKNGHFHTIDQVAKGLAALPQASRDVITNVNVEPGPNPGDAYWQKKYNRPDLRSYMTAGESGVVSIYPSKTAQPQQVVDSSMIHETGHILSQKNWGTDYTGDKWKPWRDAMKADGNSVSEYSHGSGSPGEDFAEALLVYQGYKGTKQEADMKAKFGNRYKLIEELLSGKAKK